MTRCPSVLQGHCCLGAPAAMGVSLGTSPLRAQVLKAAQRRVIWAVAAPRAAFELLLVCNPVDPMDQVWRCERHRLNPDLIHNPYFCTFDFQDIIKEWAAAQSLGALLA